MSTEAPTEISNTGRKICSRSGMKAGAHCVWQLYTVSQIGWGGGGGGVRGWDLNN